MGAPSEKPSDAVKVLAAADPLTVLGALFDTLSDDREAERDSDAAWYLLETIGDIGAAEGDEPGGACSDSVGTAHLPRRS